MKMMYHLSQEALEGITEFNVPKIFRKELLPFQQNAVQIAAHHLYKRGGVMIGDVVGLGKTITAAALAKIFLDDFSHQSLILCPPNLKDMWQSYNLKYQLSAYIMSHGEVHKLADTIRYQIVIIDESHNFRNRSGKGYNAVLDYIDRNSSKVVLLTATPYNKSYLDMAGQLRLFVDEEADLGITPEQYIEKIGGPVQFEAQHQVKPNTLAAFEKSDLPDDWTDLMRLFLIRRTRSFIKKYYTKKDENGNVYLEFSDGRRQYFSKRKPKNVPYYFDVNDKTDQYAILYSESSVDIINNLHLARYGLGNKKYEDKSALKSITEEESKIKNNMSRAGKQLTGFARTNLFKRLESSGYSFLISICRHILRNYLFVFAMENNMPFPVGKQDGKTINDIIYTDEDFEEGSEKFITEINDYKKMAEDYYNSLQDKKERYEWIRSSLFNELLKKDLLEDCDELRKILYKSKIWKEEDDRQLNALHKLITKEHADEKVLIFTEYSDTANYLFNALNRRGVKNIECATGSNHNTTELAWRFSPKSNEKKVDDEIRVLISTDVLSEGQNLQDAHIVVNYDLPWAIIRLIQRAGRVDRIGQQSDIINCYSFLPENGIETIINLRHRLKQRIAENAETVGSDEIFFPGDPVNIKDLYNEKSGIFDEEDQIDVDLSSYCYQIWRKGIEDNPTLTKIISSLPDVVYATKKTADDPKQMQGGVIVYAKTPDDNDNLTWIDENGKIVTQSYYRILRALECNANEEPLHRADNHHELVKTGLGYISENTKKIGGQLGRPTGARYRTYTRLTSWLEKNKGTLFVTEEIKRAHQDIYEFPLQNAAKEALNRALKTGANDDDIASLVVSLRDQNKLSAMPDKEHIAGEPRIICSMGLKQG
jgi:ERCC4-related helicase